MARFKLGAAGGALHPAAWPGWLAMLLALGLLLAFVQVVRGAVTQGEALRQAVALQTEATWRCQAGRGLELSQRCRAQPDSTRLDGAVGR